MNLFGIAAVSMVLGWIAEARGAEPSPLAPVVAVLGESGTNLQIIARTSGRFVFASRDSGKIFANCGGMHLEFETRPDRRHESLGLVRVHKEGFQALLGASISAPADKTPLAIGPAWPVNDAWESLAELATNEIAQATLSVKREETNRLEFSISYDLKNVGAENVTEAYEVTPEKIQITTTVDTARNHIRFRFPFVMANGGRKPRVTVKNETTEIALGGQSQKITIEDPPNAMWRQRDEPVPNRNGFIDTLETDILGRTITIVVELRP